MRRLKTDYIDLYQFHWPNRGSYMFRKNWTYDPTASRYDRAQVIADMEDCLGALQEQVDKGKSAPLASRMRAQGTTMAASGRRGGPRVASIQNEYSCCAVSMTPIWRN